MTCTELERDIALYAGGDLDDPAPVEVHLSACPDCRALLEDLQTLRRDLADLRDVTVPRRRTRIWPWALGAIAAGLLLFLIPQPAEVPPPPRIAWAPPAPAIELKPLAHARRSQPSRERQQAVTPAQHETEFVKLMTDDENVVILWAMNTKGDLN